MPPTFSIRRSCWICSLAEKRPRDPGLECCKARLHPIRCIEMGRMSNYLWLLLRHSMFGTIFPRNLMESLTLEVLAQTSFPDGCTRPTDAIRDEQRPD